MYRRPAPLPDLKAMLADGLLETAVESDKGQASRLYAEAAEEYGDLDDLTGAEAVLRRAVVAAPDADRILAISTLFQLRNDPTNVEVVATDPWSDVLGPAFVSRQQFKLLADAAEISSSETDARLALTVAMRAWAADERHQRSSSASVVTSSCAIVSSSVTRIFSACCSTALAASSSQ